MGRTVISTGFILRGYLCHGRTGIEYYYPEELLNEVYGLGGILEINNVSVKKNGIEYKKWRLFEIIASKIDQNTTYPSEIKDKLFTRIETILIN